MNGCWNRCIAWRVSWNGKHEKAACTSERAQTDKYFGYNAPPSVFSFLATQSRQYFNERIKHEIHQMHFPARSRRLIPIRLHGKTGRLSVSGYSFAVCAAHRH